MAFPRAATWFVWGMVGLLLAGPRVGAQPAPGSLPAPPPAASGAGGGGGGPTPDRPLAPRDRSSPRAALATFLETGDALGRFLGEEYLDSPTRAEFHRLLEMAEVAVGSLDLSQVPPAARQKSGRAAAMCLYATLSRITLPAWEAIPDSLPPGPGTNAVHWVLPDTEIVLVRTPGGPRENEFLFSPDTVARAEAFFRRVEGAPYRRPVPLQNLREITVASGGWMIPYRWIRSLPARLREPVSGQSAWKWWAMAGVAGVLVLGVVPAYRLSRRGASDQPFVQALARTALPAYFLGAAPLFGYLALVQINLVGSGGSAVQLMVEGVVCLAGSWICWRGAPVLAEAIIAAPQIAPESIDAHFIRVCSRLAGIVLATSLLVIGADQLGVPLYGVIAGLGVGGLAIALAAQPAIENLLGGLSLYADKSIRIGDFCRYGSDSGTVEAIGLRSTRFRGTDRTLTTIPNAALAKMSVVNLTRRDKMQLRTVLGLRYETRPDSLRHLLARIRETLVAHPRIEPESARARFIGFGASSLDVEVECYVLTTNRPDFLAVQEDLCLRLMDLVEASGSGFAFPSQTLYFARDGGVDEAQARAAEAEVRAWRDGQRLPFPEMSPEELRRLRGTLAYPPPGSGSAAATGPTREPDHEEDS